MIELKEWIDIIDGVGTIGILILIAYMLRKDNAKITADLASERASHKTERESRIMDLKKHNENSESLLEKVLVALQDNQRFLEISLNNWKQEIKDELSNIKNKIGK